MKPIALTAAVSAAALTVAVAPASADEVTETLNSAIEAYEDGDIQYALEEIAFATQLLRAMKTDDLVAFLPDAPSGWTREVNTDMNAGLAAMGGGIGAEAEYSGDGQRFSITIMADNPMVSAMSGMFGNAAMMAAAGKMVRVGREKFIDQNGDLTGVIDNRVLVQAQGGDIDVMAGVLETMDFRELGRFGN